MTHSREAWAKPADDEDRSRPDELVRVPSDEVVRATLVLRRRSDTEPDPTTRLDRVGFAERYGAHPADVSVVTDTMEGLGLRVLGSDAASRRVRVEGRAEDVERAFSTALSRGAGSGSRTRTGGLEIPSPLTGVITAVLGLEDRQLARTRHVVADPAATRTSYTPLELATVYAMPEGTGKGCTIAIIELGGGFAQADLDTYFDGLGLSSPTVTAVGVDGATNQPGKDPKGADGEVLLDIEVAGALAPDAEVLVYFAPNTDDGFLDAVSTAAHADPTPVAMSISWGQSEDQWSEEARTAMDQAFADAATLGVTVTAAAGDNGSSDKDTTGGAVHADFPASSPHVLGCGGTTLDASEGTVDSEVVWDGGTSGGATGGGVSDVFAVPDWQQHVGVPERAGTSTTGRGVPDVAANADPATGYKVRVDGEDMVIGGTSAVAPLWAGLVARIAGSGGALGLVQPKLYASASHDAPSTALRDITSGDNGAYRAQVGWDACTGLGVPDAATGDALRSTVG